MNLSMDVLRILTVKAIKGNTWAADRVFDSPATPADIRVQEDRAPFIAVFLDEADVSFVEGDQVGMGSLYAPGSATLVIEVGVATAQNFNPENPVGDDMPPQPSSYVTQLNATDEGLELQIGLISRQAIDALASTNTNNPWAELWRMLASGPNMRTITIRRGGPQTDEKGGTRPRYASRLHMIECDLLADPPRGSDLDEHPFWKTFLAAADVDAELQGVSALIRAHIEQPAGVQPEWRLAQKLLGIERDTVKGLGITPQEGFDATTVTENPVDPLADITLTRFPPDV